MDAPLAACFLMLLTFKSKSSVGVDDQQNRGEALAPWPPGRLGSGFSGGKGAVQNVEK